MATVRTLTGPYSRVNSNSRLAVHPPLGRTAVTGFSAFGSLTGPTNTSVGTRRLVQLYDPVFPLWYDYSQAELTNVMVGVTYSSEELGPLTALEEVSDLKSEYVAAVSVDSSKERIGLAGVLPFLYPGGSPPTEFNTHWPTMKDELLGDEPFYYFPATWDRVFTLWLDADAISVSPAPVGSFTIEIWLQPGRVEEFTFSSNVSNAGSSCVICLQDYATTTSPLAGTSYFMRMKSAQLSLPTTASTASTNIKLKVAMATTPQIVNPTASSCPLDGKGPTFQATITTATQVVSLFPVPFTLPYAHIDELPYSLNSVVLHSNHLTVQNMSAVVQKEGLLQGARMTLGDYYPFALSANASEVSRLDPTKKYFGALEHGVMGYVDPGSSFGRVRSPRNVALALNNKVFNTGNFYWTPFKGDCFNVYWLTDPQIATITNLGIRLSMEWEYQSTSCLVPTGVTVSTLSHVDSLVNQLTLRNPFRVGSSLPDGLSFGRERIMSNRQPYWRGPGPQPRIRSTRNSRNNRVPQQGKGGRPRPSARGTGRGRQGVYRQPSQPPPSSRRAAKLASGLDMFLATPAGKAIMSKKRN